MHKIINMEGNVFGKKLKEMRIEKCLTQREFGEIFNMCNQTVSFWESGEREPDLDTIIKIADYFDVSVDYLLGRKEY